MMLVDKKLWPQEIMDFVADAAVQDSSGHSGAKTYYIAKDQGYYLKIWDAGRLANDYHCLCYFSMKGLAPKPYLYLSEENDYLITEPAKGEPACSPVFLRQPEALARRLGEILRSFHERSDLTDCPFDTAEDPRLIADVIIHGDYCLPNVLLDGDLKFTAFLDMNAAGRGDRHHDLYWGIWSLAYNLGTDIWTDVFLDAYGRDQLDLNRLELARELNHD